ncbi:MULTISPECIES: GspE/PulE family protein [Thermoanaerobacterium]|uniref:Type II secretion system protein E n=3 Tax=Thermoanaerobacterium TaxID=28895 RepID=W9EHP1_9THEO|nr:MULTISPECIES: ATPase, T2SS/T4P/T4SS family [Thermoanaerobacterium]ADK10909.1 PilB [Thermoanaerobacterium saccharolyticum JW/SL-YS485]AFK86962.1 type II secretion system protein E [Thermoanaerobacterium saccharolyticum JW/SL-YS485]ETO39229.1 type II secretion system protein E [Thermoanaerobacterium aotearoense SCUT27]
MIKKKLGDLLVEVGLLDESQLNNAIKIQKKTGEKLGKILVKEGYLTEEQIIEALEFQLGIPHIDMKKVFIDANVAKLIPESMAKRHVAIPIKKENNSIFVAMADPLNIFAIDDIKLVTKLDVKPLIASEDGILKAIDRVFGKEEAERAVQDFKKELSHDSAEDDGNLLRDISEDEINNAPAVRLVNSIIEQAVKNRASDVHIEPTENDLRIRFRIDGELHEAMRVFKSTQGPVITRIKIMANMNIAERRIPQDGKIEMNAGGKNIDIRVSSLPTIYGEKLVLRILDKSGYIITKDKLGLGNDDLKLFDNLLKHPNGIILLTGPTGSGKTTTLYAMLNELNKPDKNIITVEDPVEYTLEGLNQVQVNEKAGLTFASALRSILRQDPDIIMIGEIRDRETAEIAIRSSITGHLVLSTLHTNDSAGAITRLIDMGIEPYLVSSSVVGVIAQRLARKICDNCKIEYDASKREKIILGIDADESLKLYRSKGCAVCNKTGYRGRVPIYEIMMMTPKIKELTNEKAPADVILNEAVSNGMSTLKESAKKLVLSGVTTVDEMLRLTYDDAY